ncbi:MAG: hypothetical protein ACHQJ6_09195 [Candidatus Berkiellales bacterium]
MKRSGPEQSSSVGSEKYSPDKKRTRVTRFPINVLARAPRIAAEANPLAIQKHPAETPMDDGRSPLSELPSELITGELYLQLDPRTWLNLSQVSKYFRSDVIWGVSFAKYFPAQFKAVANNFFTAFFREFKYIHRFFAKTPVSQSLIVSTLNKKFEPIEQADISEDLKRDLFQLALSCGHTEAAERGFLVDLDPTEDETFLFTAKYGRFIQFKNCLEKDKEKFQENQKLEADKQEPTLGTIAIGNALKLAADNKDLQMVLLLLQEKGSQIDPHDYFKATKAAIIAGSLEVVKAIWPFMDGKRGNVQGLYDVAVKHGKDDIQEHLLSLPYDIEPTGRMERSDSEQENSQHSSSTDDVERKSPVRDPSAEQALPFSPRSFRQPTVTVAEAETEAEPSTPSEPIRRKLRFF